MTHSLAFAGAPSGRLASHCALLALLALTACRAKESLAGVPAPSAKVTSSRPEASASAKGFVGAASAPARSADASWQDASVFALAGTIGGKKITGELLRLGNSVLGTYTYGDAADITRFLCLEGTVDGGQVTLQETLSGKKTGTLSGDFGSDGSVLGLWKNPAATRSAPMAIKGVRELTPDGYHLRAFGLQTTIDGALSLQNPVAYRVQNATVVLFDGRRARLLSDLTGSAHGACDVGGAVPERRDQEAFAIDKKSVRERFQRAHPSREVAAVEALFSSCTRGSATALVVIVYAEAGAKKAVGYDGDPAVLTFTEDTPVFSTTL